MSKIRLLTGELFDVTDPDPRLLTPELLAKGLSREPRFNGQTHDTYNVAQHSVLLAAVAPPEERFTALMHDASDAVYHDIAAPMKHLPELEGFRRLENLCMERLAAHYGFEWPISPELHTLDKRLASTEARDLQSGAHSSYEPLPRLRVIPWDEYKSRLFWLAAFHELTGRGRPMFGGSILARVA